MMAELMGRATGVCKGKGGSMHLSEPSVGLISTNAIVAGHIPMAGGAALSCQFRKTEQVVLCFFGDGASCEGEFFEAMNMAMLWKVPLVFICENNGIAISVPTSKSQATPDIADRARGFGMPAAIVDGNDVLAVRDAVAEGVERAPRRWRPHVRRVQDRALGAALRLLGRRQRRGRAAARLAAGRPDSAFSERARGVGGGDERRSRRHRRNRSTEMRAVREAAELAPLPAPESIYEDIFAP